MQEKKSTITFEQLPETITPLDYAEWRGCGESKAREIFNSKGFPRIKGVGAKQLADKNIVYAYEIMAGLNIDNEGKKEIITQILKPILVRGE